MNILTAIPKEKLLKFVLVSCGLVALFGLLRLLGIHRALVKDAEGLGALIQLIGEVYAVLLAFVIFVIWQQFNDVEDRVIREANALDDLLRFAAHVNQSAQSKIKDALKAYTNLVVRTEWQVLADGRRDARTERNFSEVVTAVIEMRQETDRDRLLYPQLLQLLDRASTCRDERVAKSLTRMPPTLVSLISAIAIVVLLLVFVYPFSNAIVGMTMLVTVAFVLFAAEFVVMDTDNPLKGVWNVSSRPFADLKI